MRPVDPKPRRLLCHRRGSGTTSRSGPAPETESPTPSTEPSDQRAEPKLGGFQSGPPSPGGQAELKLPPHDTSSSAFLVRFYLRLPPFDQHSPHCAPGTLI